MPDEPETEVRLDYAPGAPVRRRKRVRRALVAVALLALVGVGLVWGRGWWRLAAMRYAVYQARVYSLPPETVIYEEDAAAMQPLLARGGHVRTNLPHLRPAAVVRTDPAQLARAAGVAEQGAGYLTLFNPRGTTFEPLAFLHERTTATGLRRIVAMRITGVTYTPALGGRVHVTYNWLLIEPRGWTPPAARSLGRAWAGLAVAPDESAGGALPPGPQTPGPIRIFAAQPNPQDESALYLPYEVNGARQQLRFRLVDAGRGEARLNFDEPDVPGPAVGR